MLNEEWAVRAQQKIWIILKDLSRFLLSQNQLRNMKICILKLLEDQFSINLIGIDWFINIAESWIVLVSSAETAWRRIATLVDSLAADVPWSVVASEKAGFVAVGVAGEGASNMSRAIVGHLREVTDVVARCRKKISKSTSAGR